MDSEILSRLAYQTLLHLQRCGLRRVPRGPLDPSLDDLLNNSTLPGQGMDKPPAASSAVISQAATGGVVDGNNTPEVTTSPASATETMAPADHPTILPSPTDQDAIPDHWTLPVWEDEQRSQRLAAIDKEVRACRKCSDIVAYRTKTVFGEGPLRPTICFMGEAPGADEDRQGRPFVGRAGQLLTKIIAAMKLQRDEVYILNALKCRPPNNRTPDVQEIENCRPYVEAQLEILQPRYIVCLGAVAARSLLRATTSVGRMRGRFHQYKGAKVVVTYHPSYLLRNEDAKRLVWEDMKMLMREMGTLA
ncbi:MAG: uracil-DNA glycosylase [Pirellulaceae bacterium]|nr:MAG: uracil-DNA glycosylase [Pirellulaceae bacterium]